MQSARHRFDDPGPTVAAAYKRAMYPNAAGRMSTETSLKSINRKDLIKLHKNVFIPNNMIVAVSGRFDRKAMIKDLETIFPSSSQKAHESIFPKVSVTPVAKSLIVHKPITQSYVRIGLPLVQRPHPDYYPLSMLNTILGGSGFTSRLGTKIRSDEGLTYSIYSHSESNYLYPGTFFISFFTKTETFAKATALTLAEFEKIRKGGVTKEELTHAKKSLVGELPSMFRSPHDVVATYAWNELYGRSQDHYEVYPNKVEALTQEDILEVAKKYLDPEKLTYVVVADTATLKKMGGYKSFEFSDIKPQRTIQPNDIPSLSNKEKREKK
jgi:zinc protease